APTLKVKTARALGLTIPPGVPIGTSSLGTNEEPTPRHESAAWAFGAPWSRRAAEGCCCINMLASRSGNSVHCRGPAHALSASILLRVPGAERDATEISRGNISTPLLIAARYFVCRETDFLGRI